MTGTGLHRRAAAIFNVAPRPRTSGSNCQICRRTGRRVDEQAAAMATGGSAGETGCRIDERTAVMATGGSAEQTGRRAPAAVLMDFLEPQCVHSSICPSAVNQR